jgi:hypothetical protein
MCDALMSTNGLRSIVDSRAFPLIAVFLAAIVAAGLTNFLLVRPLYNDEGVELLQAEALKLDRFDFFAGTYPGGYTDWVEAMPLYVHRIAFIGLAGNEAVVRHDFENRARLIRVALFGVISVLIFLILARPYGTVWATAGALLWSGSAYALLSNQILTRNVWSPLWLALAFLAASRGWNQRESDGKWLWWTLVLPVSLFFGVWSYSIFKAFSCALYAALAWRIVREGAWRSVGALFAGGFLFGGLILISATLSGMDFQTILTRGAYTFRPNSSYGKNLLGCVLMVFQWQPPNGHFINEAIHDTIRIPLLPWVVSPFFAIGLLAAVHARDSTLKLAAGTVAFTLPFVALAGPNVKYPYGLTPLLLVVVIGGMHALALRIPPSTSSRTRGLLMGAGMVGLIGYFAIAIRQVAFVYEVNCATIWTWEVERHSSATMREIDAGRAPVWIFVGRGRDLFRWEVYPWDKYNPQMRIFDTWKEMSGAFAERPDSVATILCRRIYRGDESQVSQAIEERMLDPMESSR